MKLKKHVMGVGWYRKDQWDRLLEISADADDLEDAYEKWLEQAEVKFEQLRQEGVNVVKTPVDVNELLEWCQSHGRPVDGKARAAFVLEKVREKYSDQKKRT